MDYIIYYRNHGEDRLPILGVLKECGVTPRSITEQSIAGDGCLAIVHHTGLRQAIIDNGKSKTVPRWLKQNGIVVFASSDGGVRHQPSTSQSSKGQRCHVFGINKQPTQRRGSAQFLDKNEWSEIIAWAKANEGKEDIDSLKATANAVVKRLLWPDDDKRCKMAVAILCQGYLAARRSNTSASRTVQGGRWWLTPFQKALGTKSTLRLCKLIRDEWNDRPAEVELLLRRIQVGKVNQSAVVVSAYRAICSLQRSVNKTAATRNDSGNNLPTLPGKIFLVGDGLETATLAHCLSLLTEVAQIAPASLTKRTDRLDSDSNAVFVFGLDGSTATVWSSLSHLRLKQQWRGRVLVVLPPDQKRQFDGNVFVRCQDRNYPTYGFVPQPLNLNLILQSKMSLSPFREKGFERYLKIVKDKFGFSKAVSDWKKLQTITDPQRKEQAGRNLGRFFLAMPMSARGWIVKHHEKDDLKQLVTGKITRPQNALATLQMIINRIT